MGVQPVNTRTNNTKVVSVIAYLTFVGWIAAYLLNSPRNQKVAFHLRQALGINLLFIVSGLCIAVPIVGWIAGAVGYILGIVIWFFGLLYALDGEEKTVPLLGEYFQSWFAGM